MSDARYYNGEPEAEHDPNAGAGAPYVCTQCQWVGRGGAKAAEHHVNTGHAVRGRRWPQSWPNAVFAGTERRHRRTA
jgi:hypothetical protein